VLCAWTLHRRRPEATNHFDTVCALYRSLIKNHAGTKKKTWKTT
jgi:hypothetical protein